MLSVIMPSSINPHVYILQPWIHIAHEWCSSPLASVQHKTKHTQMMHIANKPCPSPLCCCSLRVLYYLRGPTAAQTPLVSLSRCRYRYSFDIWYNETPDVPTANLGFSETASVTLQLHEASLRGGIWRFVINRGGVNMSQPNAQIMTNFVVLLVNQLLKVFGAYRA